MPNRSPTDGHRPERLSLRAEYILSLCALAIFLVLTGVADEAARLVIGEIAASESLPDR